MVFAGHDAQQGTLAGAIQPEHADLRAGQERQPDVFQNDVVGLMDFAQTFHGVDELHQVIVAIG